MKYLILLALACTVPTYSLTAAEQTKMTSEKFDAFTAGSTLFFNRHGSPYGAEQYLKNKRVIWSFLDGTCQHGYWFGSHDEICFTYDDSPVPLCWHFFDDDAVQTARIVGDDPADDLTVTGRSHKPIMCLGPEVGVSFKP